jgi:hypothetical protein
MVLASFILGNIFAMSFCNLLKFFLVLSETRFSSAPIKTISSCDKGLALSATSFALVEGSVF